MTARKPLPRWPRPLRMEDGCNVVAQRLEAYGGSKDGVDMPQQHRGLLMDEKDVVRLRDWCNRWLAAYEARQERSK